MRRLLSSIPSRRRIRAVTKTLTNGGLRDTKMPLIPAPAIVIAAVVMACAAWASASYAVVDPANYRFFPPFEEDRNENMSDHLGGEYFCIATALVAGEGFSNPFHEPTGPTAWMPPLLPMFYATFLWLGGGDRDLVTAAAVLLQVLALFLTGLLIVRLTLRHANRIGGWVAAGIYLAAVLCDFQAWFQFTHDYALVLLTVSALIAGLLSGDRMRTGRSAFAWGVFGGVCALVNPIVGVLWGGMTIPAAVRKRRFREATVALVAAGLVVSPWTVRNLLVFGRLLPIKSNASYELYQSQCLQEDGLVHAQTFGSHPYANDGPERQEYAAVGEMKFLDHKAALFWRSVAADPLDFCDRIACRLLGITLWYTPVERGHITERPWRVLLARVLHPVPFLSLVVLGFFAFRQPLNNVELVAAGIYVLYFLPYALISYYDRYGLPMLGVKTLLVVLAANRLMNLVRPLSEKVPTTFAAQPSILAGAPIPGAMLSGIPCGSQARTGPTPKA
jgi:hypothetical protein